MLTIIAKPIGKEKYQCRYLKFGYVITGSPVPELSSTTRKLDKIYETTLSDIGPQMGKDSTLRKWKPVRCALPSPQFSARHVLRQSVRERLTKAQTGAFADLRTQRMVFREVSMAGICGAEI